FRPEFLNRVDETVVFHQLTKPQLRDIVDVNAHGLTKRLKDELGIDLELTEAAKDFIADKGYEPTYGARPLRRAIQQYVENPLSEELLKQTFKTGDRISVEAEGDGALARLLFKKTNSTK
ncbi:MAG: type VI secretion system ATPase TssH, partial [Myxococcales bacterium]|nr:type VI secretion system ATPase TssH [Myxococcales bacterium]